VGNNWSDEIDKGLSMVNTLENSGDLHTLYFEVYPKLGKAYCDRSNFDEALKCHHKTLNYVYPFLESIRSIDKSSNV